jgi:hypothetical protein
MERFKKYTLTSEEQKQIRGGLWVSACIEGNTYWALCNEETGNCTVWHVEPGCYA